jgi:hypothetical protein
MANDRVRQTGGRYRDETNFDFMMRMGVWTENLSLPAVLNECLLQSYDGIIRLFPNTTNLGHAGFRHLRAAGAFLVSAHWDGRAVSNLIIESEKGARLRLFNPWPAPAVLVNGARQAAREGVLELDTKAGESYLLTPA